MKKRLLSAALAMTMVFSLAACGGSESGDSAAVTGSVFSEASGDAASGDASGVKIGVIYIGDENEGYTASHMEGIDEMQEALGLSDDQVIEKTGIAEDESCYDAAVDLAEQGCNIIFATSFGHESYILQAATEYPEIQFFHATGYQAASSGLSNVHNYFTKIYEARYVAGIVAGMKLNEMIENGDITADEAKLGYVGAYPYAEVVSGYTAFFLGVRSVCESATMEVQYTNSWADMSAESEVAQQLIADGCVLISQHADTTGAPSACEEAGVPCVGYNVDMISVAPTTALVSSTNKWGVYYTEAVQAVINGETVDADWAEGFETDAVALTELNEAAIADGTEEAVEAAIAAIKDGTLHVFDTTTFTIGGESLESLIEAGGEDYTDNADYVSDGYYHESEIISAPSFDIRIDGITELNAE
ncbi:MAG: BMP family ABC transporter substrate-binding protein [Eubacterium sp.]|nr:BMP family ABC transporter substrate-binding protein [Eubacterium sp.]